MQMIVRELRRSGRPPGLRESDWAKNNSSGKSLCAGIQLRRDVNGPSSRAGGTVRRTIPDRWSGVDVKDFSQSGNRDRNAITLKREMGLIEFTSRDVTAATRPPRSYRRSHTSPH